MESAHAKQALLEVQGHFMCVFLNEHMKTHKNGTIGEGEKCY